MAGGYGDEDGAAATFIMMLIIFHMSYDDFMISSAKGFFLSARHVNEHQNYGWKARKILIKMKCHLLLWSERS